MLSWIVSKRVTAQATLLCAAVFVSTEPLAAPLANTQPILIGQSGGFTGGQADYARDMKLGIEASLVAVNAAGGIFGRQVRLITADDGGKRETVLANTKKLVESDNVLALIGYTSGAGTEASLEYINTARVPVLSPATGNMGIRASGSPYLFHTRAGYADEMGKIVGHVAGIGITRVALAYLDDVGPANLKSMQDALAAHKLTAAAVVGLNRNAQDFSAQIETLHQANAQLVIFISNAKPIAAIVKAKKLIFHLNGDSIVVTHLAPAHTDGDAMVYFTKANVLHMGDVFNNAGLPFVDLSSGGSIHGIIIAMERAYAMTNDATQIIPGHGAVTDRARLQRWHDMLVSLRTRMQQEIAAGHTVDQVLAARIAAPWEKEWPAGHERFVRLLFQELSRR